MLQVFANVQHGNIYLIWPKYIVYVHKTMVAVWNNLNLCILHMPSISL